MCARLTNNYSYYHFFLFTAQTQWVLCLSCVCCEVTEVRAIFCVMFENHLRVKRFILLCPHWVFVWINTPLFFFHLFSTALQPGHRYLWSWDGAGQCWLSSAGVRENPHTWKQRFQFHRVDWVPFCWFDRFPSKYVLPKKVPSHNSQQKIIQSKLHHSVSLLHVLDVTKHFFSFGTF